VFAKRLKGVLPVILSCGQFAFGALFILPIVFIFDHPFGRPAPDAVAITAVPGDRVLVHGAFLIYFEILRVGRCNQYDAGDAPCSGQRDFPRRARRGAGPRHFAGLALIACRLMLIDGRLLHYARRKLGGDEPSDASGLKPSRMLNDAQNL
jgi:hypothetical protein